MRLSVIEFPGSNCDHDAYEWPLRVFGRAPQRVWYTDRDLRKADLVIIPGGFSYGDYLRCGAMAARSPVMEEVVAHAKRGGYVLGICNGFQILCEAGLLPGALLRNRTLTFLCQEVILRCETADAPFTASLKKGDLLRMPIAHGDGNYYCDEKTLRRLLDDSRVAFRYVSPDGRVDDGWNFNGSMDAIAGIVSGNRRVLGMMPHPERASEALLGSTDGAAILRGAASTIEARKKVQHG